MDILQIDKPGKKVQKHSRIDYWSNVILLLYILTMPFVSAFAYTEIITLPLIFSLFLFILMVLKIIQTGKLPEGFIGIDLVIISLFSFLVLFSFIINGRGNTKSLNHTVAYLSTFMLFYVGIKFTFLNIQNSCYLKDFYNLLLIPQLLALFILTQNLFHSTCSVLI